MNKFCRILALLLAVCMLFPIIAACDETDDGSPAATTTATTSRVDDDDDDDDDESPAVTTGNSGESQVIDQLPDIDWRGEKFYVLGRTVLGNPVWDNIEIARDTEPYDVVGKAVWDRNNLLEEKYNFTVRQNLVEDPKAEMHRIYQSGEYLYDLVLYQPDDAFAHAQEGNLLDLKTTKYIELDHPSWDEYACEQLTVGGRLFLGTNDFLLMDKATVSMIVYNREKARTKGYEYLEDLVDNNQWTLYQFGELLRQFSSDTNSNNNVDIRVDSFGFAGDYFHYSTFLNGAGFRLSENKNGNVTLVGATEDMVQINEKIMAFFASDKSLFVYCEENEADYYWSTPYVLYAENRLLFAGASFNLLDSLVDGAEYEYGFLPYPKYESSQEFYYSTPNVINGTVLAIPCTVSDPEFNGFAVQALSEASTETSLKAFYEVKCKLQDSYDEKAAKMLDRIFEHIVYDVATISNVGDLSKVITSEVPKVRKNRFKNYYDKKSGDAQIALNKLISDFEAVPQYT